MTKKKVTIPPKPERATVTDHVHDHNFDLNYEYVDDIAGDAGIMDMDALRDAVDTWIEAKKGQPWSENAFHDFCEVLLKAGGINTTRDYLVTMVVKTWPDAGLKAGTLSGAWKTTEEAIYGQGGGSAKVDLEQRLSDLGIHNPEPWGELVDGEILANEIECELRRFITAADHSYPLMTLWTLHVHCLGHDWLATTPRLVFTSPRHGCGKSTAMKALWCLSPRAMMASSMTAAVLFRVIDEVSPSLFVDEIDSSPEMLRDIAACAKSGYRKNEASVLRCQGEDNVPTAYSTFAAMAFAGIGRKMDGALESRCLTIPLHGRTQEEAQKASRLKPREQSRLQGYLLPKAIRWASDNERALGAIGDMPSNIAVDRMLDLLEPLWTVAQCIGGNWPQRFLTAVAGLLDNKEDVRTRAGDLLTDVLRLAVAEAEYRTEKGNPTEWHELKFTAAELWRGLTAIDSGKWIDGSGAKALTIHSMERALSPFAPPGCGGLAKRVDNPDVLTCIEPSRAITPGGQRSIRAVTAMAKGGRNRRRAIAMADLQYARERYVEDDLIVDI